MKARAFTIIELIIAVGIIGVLAAISIPQYGSFVRRQEFNTDIQKVISCLQTAQGQAAAPREGTIYRYIGATIAMNINLPGMSCKVESFDASYSYTSLNADSPPVGTLISRSEAPVLSFASIAVNGAPTRQNPRVLRIYFDGQYHGQPMSGMVCGFTDCTNAAPLKVQPPPYSSNSFAITLGDGTFSKIITIPVLGVPIQVE